MIRIEISLDAEEGQIETAEWYKEVIERFIAGRDMVYICERGSIAGELSLNFKEREDTVPYGNKLQESLRLS